MIDPSVVITLSGERPQSWNKTYAGQFWAKRKAEVERIRMAVRAEIDPETCEVFAGPVDITVTVFFDKRPLDADNVPAKFYVDACKGWILEDDDQHHVRSVTTVSLLDTQQPRVVIEIRPVQDGAGDFAGLYYTPAGVAERYELQPAPEGSRVLVAGVDVALERELGQAVRLLLQDVALA